MRIFDPRGRVVVSICVLTSRLFLQHPFAVSIWAWFFGVFLTAFFTIQYESNAIFYKIVIGNEFSISSYTLSKKMYKKITQQMTLQGNIISQGNIIYNDAQQMYKKNYTKDST